MVPHSKRAWVWVRDYSELYAQTFRITHAKVPPVEKKLMYQAVKGVKVGGENVELKIQWQQSV